MKYLFRLGQRILVIGLVLLLINHFIIKDTFYISGIFFYAFPLPLIILGFLILGFTYIKKRKYALVIFFTIIVLSLFAYKHYYKSYESAEILEPTKSILYWNVAKHKSNNWPILADVLKNRSIDIIILLEAKELSQKQSANLKTTLPNYQTLYLRGNMFIAVKGQIEHVEYIGENTMNLKNDFRINLVEYKINTTKFRLAAIDIFARPEVRRKSAMNNIIEYSIKNKVDLIIGDFNTPYESVYFDRYKNDYNSFRDYQKGFTFTWPSILPLLEIDQVWLQKKHQPIQMKKYFYDNSDHAMLIVSFTHE